MARALRIVDAHHHLWNPEVISYGLLDGKGKLAPLTRPVLSAEFDVVARENGVSEAIVVEAASAGADPRAETDWLLAETATSPVSHRIVAYVPVERSDAGDWLDRLVAEPRIVGVRRTFESVAEGFMLSEPVVEGIRQVGLRGLPFDLVLFADRLAEAVKLVRLLPEVEFVLDHLGKPRIASVVSPQWRDQIAELASLPNVIAKLSGLTTEGDHESSEVVDGLLLPFAEHAIASFGWNRLMFGSDWPICELAGGYARWLAFATALASSAAESERFAFLSGNADSIYQMRRKRQL